MKSHTIGAWRAAILPVLAVALLLPAVQTVAGHSKNAKAAVQGPSDGQIRDYNEGRKHWESARGKDARERSTILEKSARSFQAATKGTRPFPEALLGFGLVRYSQNNLSGAKSLFSEAARLSRGPVRIEALTYLGMVALRSGEWIAADEAFEDALKEDPRDYNTWSRNEKERTTLIRAMTARGEHFKRVARVGSLLASYYDAAHTTNGRDPKLQALLRETADRFPANEIPFYQFELDDLKASLVEMPPGHFDFNHNLLDGRPSGSQKLLLEDLVQSIRIWALAELGQVPQPGLDRLSGRDLDNAIAGLQRRALRGARPQPALDYWYVLYNYPGINRYPRVDLMARQHLISIRLQQGDLAAARTLIRGRGVTNDPLAYDQQLALASAIVRTAPNSGDARFDALRRAMDEFRAVVDGLPGVTRRPSEAQLSLAEWNLAALAVESAQAVPAAEWRRRLSAFPGLPGREPILLYISTRWAISGLEGGSPDDVSRALVEADRIARGQYAPGLQPIARGDEFMISLRRFLARRIFERNEVDRYRAFLATTDYGGEQRAFESAELYRRRTSPADDVAVYNNILRLLTDARTMTGGNADLARRIDADIARVRAYLGELGGGGGGASAGWNTAADLTNRAQSAEDWAQAAQAWVRVFNEAPANSPARSQAAMHVIKAYLNQADELVASNQPILAQDPLAQAESALTADNGPGSALAPGDRDALARLIANNRDALDPRSRLVGSRRLPAPYTGAVRVPSRSQCVITRYTGPAIRQPGALQWVENLRRRPTTVRRLVDWFNNGPLSRGQYAKRDFSADPNSPNYLVDFLQENIDETTRVMPSGTVQWCWTPQKGWYGTPLRPKDAPSAAAYYLKNGTPLIRVACDNPISPIRVAPGSAWINSTDRAARMPAPPAPVITYGQPQAPFSFPVPRVYRNYVLPAPAVAPVEVMVGPPAGLFVAPQVLPILPLEVCRAVGDC